MPKRKVKKSAPNRRSSAVNPSEAQVNFTFFNSKLFVGLIAIALIVIVFAILTSINSTSTTNDGYRIDTTNLENDPSANQVIR